MRPYLAVIKDSFREAFASRVLWVLLILILLFLLVFVAPFGYRIVPEVRLMPGDIRDLALIESLVADRGNENTPAGHIAGLLTDNLNDRLGEILELDRSEEALTQEEKNAVTSTIRGLYRALNDLFFSRDFYNESAWSGVPMSSEAQALLDEGVDNLSDDETARLNRLAFDAAFEGAVEPAGEDSVAIAYLHWTPFPELPFSESQLKDLVSGTLTLAVKWLIGVFGVFVAILVTASVVPQMLDTGACDLLLSKPVSRPLLLLSKFFGGCAFILLCTTFLNTGLWLVIGLRFGIWNSGLLWTILVFVFVFAVYYSVSTAAAMIWRSAIVSIVIAILFWAACFTVGITKGYLAMWWVDTERTAAIIPAEDALLVTSWAGVASAWDDESKGFVEVFESPREGFAALEGYPFLGPLYDAVNERVVTVRIAPPATWPPQPNVLLVAKSEDDWVPMSGELVPFDAQTLMLESDGSAIVAGLDGIFRFVGDPTIDLHGMQDFGSDIELPDDELPIVQVDDGSTAWRRPFDAAIDPEAGRLAVVSGNELLVLEENDESIFEVVESADRDNSAKAVVAIAGDVVLVACEDGVIRILNRATLNEKDEYQPAGNSEPRDVAASPDGRWLVVQFYNREVWVYDVRESAPADAPLRAQGDITAVAFGTDNTLYAADGFGRVIQYRPGDGFSEVDRWQRDAGSLVSFYEWGITPLYTVFPKPGDMDNLIDWMMTRQETVTEDTDADELGLDPEREIQRGVPNIWLPLWSNLAFLVVMLTLTCVYFTRKEF